MTEGFSDTIWLTASALLAAFFVILWGDVFERRMADRRERKKWRYWNRPGKRGTRDRPNGGDRGVTR